jgi:hypothetical protein
MQTNELAGWRVNAWLESVPISKTTLYALWAVGKGPRSAKLGKVTMITEAPTEYVKRLERAT